MAVAENRLILGVDYGTTYTGIAYALVGRNQHDINVNAVRGSQTGTQIFDTTSWARRGAPKVPSVVSYSPAEGREAQWGYEISGTGVQMIWTKLQLEEQDRLEELSLVLKALDGMADLDIKKIEESKGLPSFPAKAPVEIVADYLSLVRQHLIEVELEGPNSTLGANLLRRTPVDIVLTCPNEWTDSAKAKTFQAITQAGFNRRHFPNLNNIILANEPETAALFVLKSIIQDEGDSILRVGDCIVHCDAGGGTVDVGSFRVKEVTPDLVLEEICLGAGRKCGATFVDRAFLELLEKKIGKQNFKNLTKGTLETSIGSHMAWSRELSDLMQEWENEKREFAGQDNRQYTIRSRALQDLGREVTFSVQELRQVFKFSVDSTISLITGQVGQVDRLGSRVKFVALSGGFACSDYLYNEIQNELYRARNVRTIRPVDKFRCWPAVARGAVLYGLQRDTTRFVYMHACRRNYGIKTSQPFSAFKHSEKATYQDPFDGDTKAGSQMAWMIKTGDLVLSNNGNYSSVEICRRFGLQDNRNFWTPLMANDDQEAPSGHHHREMYEVARLNYSLEDIPEEEFERLRMSNGRKSYYQARLTFHLLLKDDIHFWVTFKGRELTTRVRIDYP